MDRGRTRTDEYVAPSWSWASVRGVVSRVSLVLPREDKEILIEVIDVHLQHRTTNIFGQVISGSIYLIGSLFKIVKTFRRKVGLLKQLKSVSIQTDTLFSDDHGYKMGCYRGKGSKDPIPPGTLVLFTCKEVVSSFRKT